MFLFYVLSFFLKGDTIQGGHYSRGDIIQGNTVYKAIYYGHIFFETLGIIYD